MHAFFRKPVDNVIADSLEYFLVYESCRFFYRSVPCASTAQVEKIGIGLPSGRYGNLLHKAEHRDHPMSRALGQCFKYSQKKFCYDVLEGCLDCSKASRMCSILCCDMPVISKQTTQSTTYLVQIWEELLCRAGLRMRTHAQLLIEEIQSAHDELALSQVRSDAYPANDSSSQDAVVCAMRALVALEQHLRKFIAEEKGATAT
jgi:hypothetical protein